ncbi:MAG: glycosyltransferase [Candidatus Thorarchaeota archaeon]
MRILVVQESDWLRRGPHQQHQLMERLQQRGHDVRVIDYEIAWRENSNREFFASKTVLRAPGKVSDRVLTTIIRPAMIRAPLLCYLLIPIFHSLEIIRQIKSFKPDIIMGMGILNTLSAALIAKLYRVPFLYYLIDSLHTLVPERLLRPIAKLMEKWTISISDNILVINQSLSLYAKRMGSVSIPEVLTAGIDSNRFHSEVESQSKRIEMGFEEDDLVLFFMGWLYEFSGLLEVAQDIVSHPNPNVKLLILGRGDLFDQLQTIVRNQNHQKRVALVDWVRYDEVPSYIAVADICILPANLNEIMREIVPIKLYEYLACGKPVVVTKLPGVFREFGVRSGIVYADDPKSVVELALNIFQNKEKYSQLSRDAIRFTASLDWSEITNRFESVLSDMVPEY